MAPPLAVLIMAGIACLESRNMLSTLICITRRYCSCFSSTTLPRLPMPTLLSRKSSRPQRSAAASTIRWQSASLVTSQAMAAAVPPSARIISTVRSASLRSRSATSTLVPARASRIAAARPLPMPSPAAPPPLTMATLSVKPESSSGPFITPLPLASVCVYSCRTFQALWMIYGRYRLIGSTASPYAIKLRALLRYRRIPFDWVIMTKALRKQTEHLRPNLIPVLQYPDGSFRGETTTLAYDLEARHSDRSVIPEDKAVSFACDLLEH